MSATEASEQSADLPILKFVDVEVAYDHLIEALRGVSLVVPRGAIVALLGANGAGKSTTLKAAAGLLGAERGAVERGSIEFEGRAIHHRDARELVSQGIVQVLEGRHCFPHLTVEENLLSGALGHNAHGRWRRTQLDKVYGYFPRLTSVRRLRAGLTSGGEQQMVAIGRALMARPRLVLLDEPSMGLAPQIVEEIFKLVRRLNQEEGISFLLAEQNARVALRYASFGYVLENGRAVLQGTASDLLNRSEVKEFYLGVGGKAHAPAPVAVP